jgi:hypothetical protein
VLSWTNIQTLIFLGVNDCLRMVAFATKHWHASNVNHFLWNYSTAVEYSKYRRLFYFGFSRQFQNFECVCCKTQQHLLNMIWTNKFSQTNIKR